MVHLSFHKDKETSDKKRVNPGREELTVFAIFTTVIHKGKNNVEKEFKFKDIWVNADITAGIKLSCAGPGKGPS